MMDSRRIISGDRDGLLCVWLAESGTMLQTLQGPYKSLAATNNMKFAVNKNIYYYVLYSILYTMNNHSQNVTTKIVLKTIGFVYAKENFKYLCDLVEQKLKRFSF